MTILHCRLLAALALFAALAAAPGSARAETYHTCEGFIDSLPAIINTQGVWCLRKNLATNITSGSAITIAANNVTIDCNDFKIGGLAAGDASNARGILALNRQNATVRHCTVRGFSRGIELEGGAGHLVEDNRLDNNLVTALYVMGDNSTVRRNRVFDTGGFAGSSGSRGIEASADVIDNVVAGVFTTTPGRGATGIMLVNSDAVIRNNRVRGLQPSAGGQATGLWVLFANGTVTVDRNQVIVPAGTVAWGVIGDTDPRTVCTNNFFSGFSTGHAISDCLNAGGNTSL